MALAIVANGPSVKMDPNDVTGEQRNWRRSSFVLPLKPRFELRTTSYVLLNVSEEEDRKKEENNFRRYNASTFLLLHAWTAWMPAGRTAKVGPLSFLDGLAALADDAGASENTAQGSAYNPCTRLPNVRLALANVQHEEGTCRVNPHGSAL